ncbi:MULTISPECIES: hypothetical protein [Metallosphaera]|uniref:hypothetical protein n=1 Tax=Metallosphaera TaxID=41980 RepID=UPI001F06190F|nr:hypothetical protein [Metallosphaera sedula]MCH1770307.1 hypothetical protein [Metallosphaera sedula]MCP6727859.1 hypothetical protein [Metallosphaera sedula]
MRTDILVFLAYKYAKDGKKDAICREMTDRRFVIVSSKKTTDLLLYLISKNIGLDAMMYVVDSNTHVSFSNVNDLNALIKEISMTLYDDDNKTFLQSVEDDGSLFFMTERKGIYVLKRLESDEFYKMCTGEEKGGSHPHV